MKNNEFTIRKLQNKLKIYTYNPKEKNFTLGNNRDMEKHALIFDDLKVLTRVFKNNDIKYFLNENDLSINIKT